MQSYGNSRAAENKVLKTMADQMKANDGMFSVAVLAIVNRCQFLNRNL